MGQRGYVHAEFLKVQSVWVRIVAARAAVLSARVRLSYNRHLKPCKAISTSHQPAVEAARCQQLLEASIDLLAQNPDILGPDEHRDGHPVLRVPRKEAERVLEVRSDTLDQLRQFVATIAGHREP